MPVVVPVIPPAVVLAVAVATVAAVVAAVASVASVAAAAAAAAAATAAIATAAASAATAAPPTAAPPAAPGGSLALAAIVGWRRRRRALVSKVGQNDRSVGVIRAGAQLDALALELVEERLWLGDAIVAQVEMKRRRWACVGLETVTLPVRILDELRGACQERQLETIRGNLVSRRRVSAARRRRGGAAARSHDDRADRRWRRGQHAPARPIWLPDTMRVEMKALEANVE